jgi:hypothetical protein
VIAEGCLRQWTACVALGLLALASAGHAAAAADLCRSAEGASGIASSPDPRVPHLTGIVIANGRRQALFKTPDERSIAVVLEGGGIDGFDVMAIATGRVELRCRSETYYVSPVPDPSYRAAMIASQPRSPMPASVQQAQADSDK